MNKEEVIYRLSMLEQHSQELKKQLDAIENQKTELEMLKRSVECVGKNKNKEMLASLGKGLFVRTKIEDDHILVNIGEKVVVKKTPKEAEEIIDAQSEEMDKMKKSILESLEETNSQLLKIVEEAQSMEA